MYFQILLFSRSDIPETAKHILSFLTSPPNQNTNKPEKQTVVSTSTKAPMINIPVKIEKSNKKIAAHCFSAALPALPSFLPRCIFLENQHAFSGSN